MNTVRESESGQERRKNTETNREEAGWGDIGSAMLIARLEEYKQIWSSIPANITGLAIRTAKNDGAKCTRVFLVRARASACVPACVRACVIFIEIALSPK